MNRRFFSERPIDGDSIQLSRTESQHVARVLRAKIGDRITIFDGSGAEFVAEIVALERAGVQLRLVERIAAVREASRQLVLGVALPKGDRQRWLIEKCVELGVHQIVPLRTARGIAVPQASVIERLKRFVIEASKQCGRNRLLQIEEPSSVREFVHTAPEESVRWLAHPHLAPPAAGKTSSNIESRALVTADRPVAVAIGPEGGFDEVEVDAAVMAGWTPVRLAESILRVETAALAVVAYWLVDPNYSGPAVASIRPKR